MAVRRILLLGDPVLREVSAPVRSPAEAGPVLVDLRDTLAAFRRDHGFGRAISAVQIGEPQRILYLEFESQAYSLLNPEFEERGGGTFRLWDDCFSFPGLMVYLERYCRVAVRYLDENGAERRLEADGALSELLQHEMDHLDGILAVDRAIGRDGFAMREEFLRRRGAPPASATHGSTGASNKQE